MEADALEPLTEAEVSALMEELAGSEIQALYEGDINRPLTSPEGRVLRRGKRMESAVSAAVEDQPKAGTEEAVQDEDKDAEPGLKLSYSKLTIGVGEKCDIS